MEFSTFPLLHFTQSVELFFFSTLRNSFKEAVQPIKNLDQKPSPGASLQFQLIQTMSHCIYHMLWIYKDLFIIMGNGA